DTLRHQFHLHFAFGYLFLARRRRAGSDRERGDQLLHLLVLRKDLAARRARIAQGIADKGKLLRALFAQGEDQAVRDSVTHAETGDGDGRPVLDIRDGLFRRCDNLVHGRSLEKIKYPGYRFPAASGLITSIGLPEAYASSRLTAPSYMPSYWSRSQ